MIYKVWCPELDPGQNALVSIEAGSAKEAAEKWVNQDASICLQPWFSTNANWPSIVHVADEKGAWSVWSMVSKLICTGVGA